MNSEKITNKKHKDTIFRLLFNNKKEALTLYNNLFDTDYKDEALIDIVTLEDVLFTPRKNDIAFTMNGKFLILLEHQSTINENMPLRFLIYVARLYEKIIDVENVYKKHLIKIPNPEFMVLYNGKEDLKKNGKKVTELDLNLSDAFKENSEVKLQLKVKVIDIRYSSQNKIVTKKDTLEQYSHFIQIVEDCKKEIKNLDEAMKKAVNIAIEQGILVDFLKKHSSEVRNMLTLEYNEEIAKKVEREEAREEGREEGRKEGRKEARKDLIRNCLKNGKSCEMISEFFDIPLEEVRKVKDNM
jgi:predicted transposase/invertase (TIGR01784 family)